MAEGLATGPALVEQMFAIIDARRWEELHRVFHDEMTYHRPGYAPLVGRASVEHFYREVRVLASGAHHLEGLIGAGAQAACWGRFIGVTHSGEAIDVSFADWYRFCEGKVIARRSFFFVPAV